MQYGATVTSPPASEPVTLRDVKQQINQSDQFVRDDVYLMTKLVPQARREFEQYTGQALITQTVQLTLDYQPPSILLPRNPVQRVDRLEYWHNEQWHFMECQKFQLVNDREPAIVELRENAVWPDRSSGRATLRVTFSAGYGDEATDVPIEIVGCILRLVESYYRFRGAGELPDGLYAAMEQFRVGDEFTQYGIGTARGILG